MQTTTPRRAEHVTFYTWDHEYIRAHCTHDFNSIFKELWSQAEEFNYEIYPHELEEEADRIISAWANAYND